MSRGPRLDAPGIVHHVIQRGVERRVTFLDHADRLDFLRRLARTLPEEGVRCLAWVLMPNHFHLVLQSGERPMWKSLHRITGGYAMRFNKRHDRVGHLVQNRFRSRIARDDEDVKGLIRYVHRNPLRAGLVASLGQLERYPWSGHGALVGRRRPESFHSAGDALAYFGETPSSARNALRTWMADVEPLDDCDSLAPTRVESGSSPFERFLLARRRLCLEHGIAVADLAAGSREGAISRVRQQLAVLAIRELRLSTRGIATALGASPSAVARAARQPSSRRSGTVPAAP